MKILIIISLTFIVLVSYSQKNKEQNTGIKNLKKVSEEHTVNQNYQDVRIKNFPLAVQCWTFRKFSFLETLEKVKELGIRYLQAYPNQILSSDDPNIKFDHHLDNERIALVQEKLKMHGLAVISYGVVRFENTEENMREVFDFAKKLGIKIIVTEPEYDDYSLLEQMVKEYNIQIAIHNHPEPSKYARPEVVVQHIEGRDERIGSCADTGHWMRGGINPVDALRLLRGRILDVHLKDRNRFGTTEAYDVPFGQGEANIHDILAELTLQNYHGYLTIEHENEEDVYNPSPSIKKGVEYIKSITYYADYEELLKWRNGRYTKHGWNHYGPGYFELDEKTGILKSHGGMGLFWFSQKKYQDFILELDYRCLDKTTNSGIFLRVPETLVSNDYIYNSFEIQIDDAGEGIHKTGAVYDAEPPGHNAFNETGEWNHYKITFKGKNIKVELNGQKIIDWDAEPRGKIKDFTSSGYIGLQNHDKHTSVWFKNIYVKSLSSS